MSSTSSNNIFYFVICFALLLQTSLGQLPIHLCSGEGSPTPTYKENLKKLLHFLYTETPDQDGYSYRTYPRASPNDQVHGLALCRGDVSSEDCKNCVADAVSYLINTCSNNKQGMVWYDKCGLKYSEYDFHGQIDNGATWYMENNQGARNGAYFDAKLDELFILMQTVDSYKKKKFFWSGRLSLKSDLVGDGADELYAMAQCTRDLILSDCEACIDDAREQLPTCCDGKLGAKVVTGSCTIRYEVYPFLDD